MSHYKAYPEYKESGAEFIWNIPKDWELKRLRHVAIFNNSNVDKKSYEDQADVKLCNYTDVYYNEFITPDLEFMNATANESEIDKFRLAEGDVIITKDSEDPNDIGIPALVKQDMHDVVCGYHLTVIKSHEFDLSGFIHRSIQSHPTKAHFFVESPGITRYGLDQDAIGDIPVCIPPKEHRSTIVSAINTEINRINTLITKKTRFIELLKEKRQALITHAVTKGLNPDVKMKDSGVEWIGEVPYSWSVKKLKFIARSIIGLTYSPDDVVSDGSGTLVLRSSNIQNGQLSLKDCVRVNREIPKHLSVCLGDILICSRNGSRDLIGKNIQLDSRTEGASFGAFMTVIRGSINDFLYYVFNSSMFEAQSDLFMTSTVNQLTISMLDNMKVAIPEEAELTNIVSHLRQQTYRIDTLITKTQESIALLKERRSAFITAAVTGQIDLRGDPV
tara:strand:+ start:3000 stop:4337 length:1338 start_codon:yes stop_codon:yes gene_type:complete